MVSRCSLTVACYSTRDLKTTAKKETKKSNYNKPISLKPAHMNAEQRRLQEDRDQKRNWRRFGPYLTDRQWGTVREDYSAHGNAWEYVSHDAARSKAYRWGEEGIAGISDEQQLLCFSIGLWNREDPIL